MSDLRIHIPQEFYAPAEYAHFEGAYDLPVLKAGPDLYSFAAPVSWAVDITNVGDALLVTGSAQAEAVTSCARCLNDVALQLFGEVEGYFLIGADSAAPEDMEDDEFDVLPEDGAIDLTPLIEAALLVELPLIPLCDEDCKGLCATCGADLNEGPCACTPEDDEAFSKENPFAVLKGLRFDDADAGLPAAGEEEVAGGGQGGA